MADKVNYKVKDQWAIVYKDGKRVASYSLLAEDYAINLAMQHVGRLKAEINKEEKLA